MIALDTPDRAIATLTGSRYSPNLRTWLLANERPYWGFPSVYTDRDGVLWIGWIDDAVWFIGTRLMRVLTVGRKANVGAWTFPVTDLTEMPDFWRRYRRIGRCAIDAAHVRSFVGDEQRWAESGDVRDCRWCGDHRQYRHRWTERVERERWTA